MLWPNHFTPVMAVGKVRMNTSAVASYASLRTTALDMVPRLRARARQAEEARRLPQETVRELKDAGLFAIQKPARYGGLELGLEELVDLVAIIGRGCGSTAWVYGVTAGRALLLAKFGDEVQQDVWAGANDGLITSCITPEGTADRVPGGYRVTGHWHFVSGIDIADWAVFCAMAETGRTGDPRVPTYFAIPIADCEVIDTWHVAGLAATGSRDVKVTGAFVPEHRTVSMTDLREGGGPGTQCNPAGLYRLPLIAINPYPILAPVIGMAEAALELYVRQTSERRTAGTGVPLVQNQMVQMRVAQAESEIDAAKALVTQDCRDAMSTVARGDVMSVEQRIRIRRNHGFATQLLVAAVDRLFTATGGRGIYLDHDMQRLFRDVHAAAAHIGLSWEVTGTMWGQHRFGLPVGSQVY
jgi:3-hydroxy-9,10-secoandrosta-1,3,5(10)-triene-9,17-dione monooxygenase